MNKNVPFRNIVLEQTKKRDIINLKLYIISPFYISNSKILTGYLMFITDSVKLSGAIKNSCQNGHHR